MKRLLRIAWVLAANGFVAWFTINRLSPEIFTLRAWDSQMWIECILEILFPISGIVLELFSSKFAKWVNIGCFAVAGCYWLGEAVWWRSDPFFGVLLIVAVGLFVLAGITETVYRRTLTRDKT